MADDLQDLFVEQSTTIASIKRVILNFKKIGKANITLYKAKNRVKDLETLWEKCQRLNVRLLQVATAKDRSPSNTYQGGILNSRGCLS